MSERSERWDADDLERVLPTHTEQEVDPDAELPLDSLAATSGPRGVYTPMGEATQIASFWRGVGTRGGWMGRALVAVVVLLIVVPLALGLWSSLTKQTQTPADVPADAPSLPGY